MGNCCGRVSGDKPVKILGLGGDLNLISAPVTAAELMLESPGYFVAAVENLRLTRRATAAKADEQLVPGKAYMLVPVERVGATISEPQLLEVERLIYDGGKKKKSKASRRRMGGSKVLPEVVNVERNCEDDEGFGWEKSDSPAGGVDGGCRRLRNGRPWTPVLEPILEGC